MTKYHFCNGNSSKYLYGSGNGFLFILFMEHLALFHLWIRGEREYYLSVFNLGKVDFNLLLYRYTFLLFLALETKQL